MLRTAILRLTLLLPYLIETQLAAMFNCYFAMPLKQPNTNAFGYYVEVSTFVTLWTPQKFQARVADPKAQAAPVSTFRTPGWARTCLIKIAYIIITWVKH